MPHSLQITIMVLWWNRFIPYITTILLIVSVVIVSLDSKCCSAYTCNIQYHRSSSHLSRQVAHAFPNVQLPQRMLFRSWPSLLGSLKYNEENNRYEGLLQKLIEPFDRWRYLQKLLDDDINDASEILFLLQTSVRQQLQIQAQPDSSTSILESRISSVSSPLLSMPMNDVEEATVSDSESKIEKVATTTEIATPTPTVITKAKSRRQIMEYIINDVSSETIHNLIQPVSNPDMQMGDNEIHFLEQIEYLLPNPEIDDDAAKGLWDTIIELHGRESVKINERTTVSQNNMGWKTRCLIARLLIYYDFFIIGLYTETK